MEPPPEFKEATEEDLINEITGEDYELKKLAIREALFSYLKWLEVNPLMTDYDQKIGRNEEPAVPPDEKEEEGQEQGPPKIIHRVIDWDKQSDDKDAIRMIAKLALLLARIRGNVVSYQTKVMTHLKESGDDNGKGNDSKPDSNSKVADDDNDVEESITSSYQYEYGHGKPIIERPERPAKVLYNLARAHAYELCGRTHITQDLPVIIKIVLSAANRNRIAVIKALLNAKKDLSGLSYAELNTTRQVDMNHIITELQLVHQTQISRSSIQRTIVELTPLGLIDIYKTKSKSHKNAFCFKSKFSWVYDAEFQELLKIAFPNSVR